MKKRILIIVYVLLLCGTITFAWLSNAQSNINEYVDVQFNSGKAIVVDLPFKAYLERKLAEGENDTDSDGYVRVNGDFSFDTKATIPGSRLPFRIRIQNPEAESKGTKLVLDMYIEGYDPNSEEEFIRNKADFLDAVYIEIVLGEGFNAVVDDESDTTQESGTDETDEGETDEGESETDETQNEDESDEKVETRHIFKKLSEATYKGDGIFSLEIYGENDKLVIPTKDAVIDYLDDPYKTTGYVALNCSFYYDQNAGAEYQGMGIDSLFFRLEQ